MNVVEHRPPLKRIEIGSRPHVPTPPNIYAVDRSAEFAEYERIWRLIEQAARSVGVRSENVEG